jgi:predicted phosphoribosyltransferase
VGLEVARALEAPLDLLVVRGLGVPGRKGLVFGAVAGGDVCVMDDEVVRDLRIPARVVGRIAAREAVEVERLERANRTVRPAPGLPGKIVIVVDDGTATGTMLRAALASLPLPALKRVVVATPVLGSSALLALRHGVDGVVWLSTPEPSTARPPWNRSFPLTLEDDARELLSRETAGPVTR